MEMKTELHMEGGRNKPWWGSMHKEEGGRNKPGQSKVYIERKNIKVQKEGVKGDHAYGEERAKAS